jgi:hypothetical protein
MYTIAEAMFPDVEIAILGVDPEHTSDEALIASWQSDSRHRTPLRTPDESVPLQPVTLPLIAVSSQPAVSERVKGTGL